MKLWDETCTLESELLISCEDHGTVDRPDNVCTALGLFVCGFTQLTS